MKSQTESRTHLPSLSLSLAIAATLAAGCSSIGQRKGDTAALGLQKAAAEVQAESRALELTMGALRDLVNEPNGDLKRPLKHYSTALDRLIAAAERTETTGLRMAQRNAEYLQAWDKQLPTIDYEHIREVSQKRKAEVTSRCESINHRYADSQSVVHPLIDYLQDLRRAMNVDLTVNGLEALKPIAQNAQANAEKVQTALTALANELTDSGARLSSLATTAPGTQ
jgi:hypothetical protein